MQGFGKYLVYMVGPQALGKSWEAPIRKYPTVVFIIIPLPMHFLSYLYCLVLLNCPLLQRRLSLLKKRPFGMSFLVLTDGYYHEICSTHETCMGKGVLSHVWLF